MEKRTTQTQREERGKKEEGRQDYTRYICTLVDIIIIFKINV
jgi:hypothetical protein